LQYYQVLGTYIKIIGSKEHPFYRKFPLRNSVIKICAEKNRPTPYLHPSVKSVPIKLLMSSSILQQTLKGMFKN